MALYNNSLSYNDSTLDYNGVAYTVSTGRTLCYHMNRLAQTLINDLPQYDTDGAAVRWGRLVLGANDATREIDVLNKIYASRNGGKNYNWDTPGVLNGLAGTWGLGEVEAASRIES